MNTPSPALMVWKSQSICWLVDWLNAEATKAAYQSLSEAGKGFTKAALLSISYLHHYEIILKIL